MGSVPSHTSKSGSLDQISFPATSRGRISSNRRHPDHRRILMRCTLALVTLAAVAALTSSPAAAPADGERRVSLQVKDLPLRTALAELTRQYGARFEVAPDIPDVPITLSARDE